MHYELEFLRLKYRQRRDLLKGQIYEIAMRLLADNEQARWMTRAEKEHAMRKVRDLIYQNGRSYKVLRH